jgi:DNA-directed RNA polymerase subunit K/omega
MSNKKESEEQLSEEEAAALNATILQNIPGVGPKTAEKLLESEFSTLDAVVEAEAEALAEAIPGFSVSKAEDVINAAKQLQQDIADGKVDPSGKAKRSKRKKAVEPDPDVHELPPAQEMKEAEILTSLETGLDREKVKLGVLAGPKWLTKFERARIVGARALQISMGAPILVDPKKSPNSLFALAETELKEGKLPMTVRRTLPTGESFDISLAILLKNTRLD